MAERSLPPHSVCIQRAISQGEVGQAVAIFSQPNDRGEIPIVLIPACKGWVSVYATIPSGCYALGQKFGKDMGRLKAGLQFFPPWWRIAYLVTSQVSTYNAPIKECPTSDNVRVSLDISVSFVIDHPQNFVYSLGATHFDVLLSGAVDEAIRMTVRRRDHSEVFGLKGKKSEDLLKSLNGKFEGKGVYFQDCKVKNVILPPSLFQSLQNTTEMKQKMATENRQQEFEIAEIRRDADVTKSELERRNEQVEVEECAKVQKAQLILEQKTVAAEETRSIETLKVQEVMQVKKMETKAMVDRQESLLEGHRLDVLSQAEADSKERMVQADLKYQEALVEAEAEMQRLDAKAKAILLDANAEGEGAKNLQSKRKFDVDLREKQILKKLAEKGKFNLIGTHGDRMIEGVMSGNLQGVDRPHPSSGGWVG